MVSFTSFFLSFFIYFYLSLTLSQDDASSTFLNATEEGRPERRELQ